MMQILDARAWAVRRFSVESFRHMWGEVIDANRATITVRDDHWLYLPGDIFPVRIGAMTIEMVIEDAYPCPAVRSSIRIWKLSGPITKARRK